VDFENDTKNGSHNAGSRKVIGARNPPWLPTSNPQNSNFPTKHKSANPQIRKSANPQIHKFPKKNTQPINP
jgi:hypothetical protein